MPVLQILEGDNSHDPGPNQRRYRQRIALRMFRLSGFHPSKYTLEKGDIPQISKEFKHFLK